MWFAPPNTHLHPPTHTSTHLHAIAPKLLALGIIPPKHQKQVSIFESPWRKLLHQLRMQAAIGGHLLAAQRAARMAKAGAWALA